MTIDELRAMVDGGQFHHATYRDHGTLWEGLWIYQCDPSGFRGYSPSGAFFKGSPDLDAAYTIIRGSGVSFGAYGVG